TPHSGTVLRTKPVCCTVKIPHSRHETPVSGPRVELHLDLYPSPPFGRCGTGERHMTEAPRRPGQVPGAATRTTRTHTSEQQAIRVGADRAGNRAGRRLRRGPPTPGWP